MNFQKFNETTSPEKRKKERFLQSHITEADYVHAKKLCKDLKISRAISWFICWKQYIKISWCIWELSKYDFDTAHFLSTQELAYEAALRKTIVKIDPSTNIDSWSVKDV